MVNKLYTEEPKVQKRNSDGLDLQAIKYNLSLAPEKRLKQHQSSLEAVYELEKAHKELYEKPQSAS